MPCSTLGVLVNRPNYMKLMAASINQRKGAEGQLAAYEVCLDISGIDYIEISGVAEGRASDNVMESTRSSRTTRADSNQVGSAKFLTGQTCHWHMGQYAGVPNLHGALR